MRKYARGGGRNGDKMDLLVIATSAVGLFFIVVLIAVAAWRKNLAQVYQT